MPKCLVICPFGEEGTETRNRSDWVYNNFIKPVTDNEGYETYRILDKPQPGEITAQVIKDLYNVDLVIADLTDSNPNVFYELALRHSTGKPFIHIVDPGGKIPFDVSPLNVIKIKSDLKEGQQAQNELRSQIQQIRTGKAAFDNPASRHHPNIVGKKDSKDRRVPLKSIRIYGWQINYENNLATEWLKRKGSALQEYVDRFLRDEIHTDEIQKSVQKRKILAEYLAYKTTQGQSLPGELFYIVDNTTQTFKGHGIFALPGSDPLTIFVNGDEYVGGKKIIFKQPSRKFPIGMGIVEEIQSFDFAVDFVQDPSRKIWEGVIFHPDFQNSPEAVIVGKTKLIPHPEIN